MEENKFYVFCAKLDKFKEIQVHKLSFDMKTFYDLPGKFFFFKFV